MKMELIDLVNYSWINAGGGAGGGGADPAFFWGIFIEFRRIWDSLGSFGFFFYGKMVKKMGKKSEEKVEKHGKIEEKW